MPVTTSQAARANLTQLEHLAINSPLNVADGHARQALSETQQRIVADLPALFARSAAEPAEELERAAVEAFFGTSGQHSHPIGPGRVLDCYASSVAMEIPARSLVGAVDAVALVHPTFDDIPDILRGFGLRLLPVEEDVLHGGDLATGVPAEAGCRYAVIEDTGKIRPTLDLEVGWLVSGEDVGLPLPQIHSGILLGVSPFIDVLVERFARDAAAGGPREPWGHIADNRAALRSTLAGLPGLSFPDADSAVSVERVEIAGVDGVRLWRELASLQHRGPGEGVRRSAAAGTGAVYGVPPAAHAAPVQSRATGFWPGGSLKWTAHAIGGPSAAGEYRPEPGPRRGPPNGRSWCATGPGTSSSTPGSSR